MSRYRVVISVESGELEPNEFPTFDAATHWVDQCADILPGYVDHLIEEVKEDQP